MRLIYKQYFPFSPKITTEIRKSSKLRMYREQWSGTESLSPDIVYMEPKKSFHYNRNARQSNKRWGKDSKKVSFFIVLLKLLIPSNQHFQNKFLLEISRTLSFIKFLELDSGNSIKIPTKTLRSVSILFKELSLHRGSGRFNHCSIRNF